MSKSNPARAAVCPAVLIAGLILALPASALAQTKGPVFSGQVSALSDGIYRGVSQTEGLPQFNAYAQIAFGKVYIATRYKSMRDRSTGVDNQTQAIIGYKTNWSGFDISACASYKRYNGVKPGIDKAFMEYETVFSRKIAANTTARLTLAYSPDNYGSAKVATFSEVGLEQKLTPKFSLQAATGFRHNEHSVDYTNYLVGATYALNKTLSVAVTFTTTDKAKFGDKYGDSTFLTLTQKF